MANTQQIREHMEVIGADDVHVGVVDRVEPSNGIKLTRSDPLAEGEHHYVPLDWVERVDALSRSIAARVWPSLRNCFFTTRVLPLVSQPRAVLAGTPG